MAMMLQISISYGLPRSLTWLLKGCVSLMIQELSKIFSWNLCIVEIVLLMRISSWNLGTHTNFSLKFSSWMWFMALNIFARLFSRACEMIVKQPPRWWHDIWNYLQNYWPFVRRIPQSWIPHTKGQLCRGLIFPLLLISVICWTKSWVACDLRCCDTSVTCHYNLLGLVFLQNSPIMKYGPFFQNFYFQRSLSTFVSAALVIEIFEN